MNKLYSNVKRLFLCRHVTGGQTPCVMSTLFIFFSFLFVYSEIMFNFAAEIKWIAIMDVKKITHEEALRRWKHSLEIKREWERKVAERWANEDQQEIALV